MRQIIYAMQFKGQAGPGDGGKVLARSASDSCRITSAVTGAGSKGKSTPRKADAPALNRLSR